ncbi:NADPH-dependent F420 reductase [Nocardia sp. NPDC101769]|uniref:NADPH-dependent F420 reductase n=1 Tax=Nocardia sp. NPDC101769 TaxID=3364333 RepID=UPI0038260DB5
MLARVLVEAGYPVSIAASGDPVDIALIVDLLAPGASPRWAEDAIAEADIVILALPLSRFTDLGPEAFVGKIVVDTMNYWPPTDGIQPIFDHPELGSSEIVARHLPGARVVKTLNHIGYHDLADARRPPGDPDRLALMVAADDPAAAKAVAEVVEDIGYDAVVLPTLAAGRILQPGGPYFGAELRRDQIERELLP